MKVLPEFPEKLTQHLLRYHGLTDCLFQKNALWECLDVPRLPYLCISIKLIDTRS